MALLESLDSALPEVPWTFLKTWNFPRTQIITSSPPFFFPELTRVGFFSLSTERALSHGTLSQTTRIVWIVCSHSSSGRQTQQRFLASMSGDKLAVLPDLSPGYFKVSLFSGARGETAGDICVMIHG